jgi:hypothetical protein
MSENSSAENYSIISNALTGADLAWSAIVDSANGNPLGTTATSRYGVAASTFGMAEQLAIWESSNKSYEDFERF